MFETDKEYLEKEKKIYAKRGLKIDNEETILKKRKGIFAGILILTIYISLSIGFILGMIMGDIGESTIITKTALDTACKEIFGDEFEFVETRVGSDLNLNCKASDVEIIILE